MCGVFGINGHDEAANITYLGLHALQHRGQESAGLVAAEAGELRRHAAMGLVSDAFNRDVLAQLPDDGATGAPWDREADPGLAGVFARERVEDEEAGRDRAAAAVDGVEVP